MKQVRIGIVGVGSQGTHYASFLTGNTKPGSPLCPPRPQHAVLGALCDIDEHRAAFCREEYPDIPFFSDWKEMALSGKVDAVVTTVPHYLHPEIAIFCLEHGVHVLGEKPAGVYAKSVREMNECAARHPELTFGVMFMQRTNRLYQRIKQIVDSGEMGSIRRSMWIINTWWRPDIYYKQSAWRATWGGEGGGVLVNQAPHQLDLWQWICGMPVKMTAKIGFGRFRDIAVDNDVTVLAEYANGATGTFITCTHDACGTDRFEIDLDGGKIVVEDGRKATVYRLSQPESVLNRDVGMEEFGKIVSGNASGGLYTTETFENVDGWGVQHTTVIENFARHIVDGTPLFAPGAEGINGVNLANAALLSAWLGKEVEVPVDEDLYLKELNKRIEQEGLFPCR